MTKLGRAPVYNLQVDGVPEFFANGILVHNCDAAAWAFVQITGKAATGNSRERARAHFNPWATAEEFDA